MPKPWEPEWNGADWQVDFRVKGRRVRRRLGIRDHGLQSLARKEARRLYEAEWQRPADEVAGRPFWKAAEAYKDAGGEARFLPRIMMHFGRHACVEDIGEVEIAEAGAALYPDASPATIRRQVRVPIVAVLRFARGERRQGGTDTPRTRWLTPEEAERLLDCAGRIRPMVAFLLGSGCRTGEMFALEAQHVNTATRQAFIEDTKNGHPRWVTLPEKAWRELPVPEVGAVFRTPKGLPYALREKGGGQIQGAFNKARDLAGLGGDVTPHSLRHTHATWFYAQTKDLFGLMQQGGWRKADMALRYTKLAPADLSDTLLKYGWDFHFGRRPKPTLRAVNDGYL